MLEFKIRKYDDSYTNIFDVYKDGVHLNTVLAKSITKCKLDKSEIENVIKTIEENNSILNEIEKNQIFEFFNNSQTEKSVVFEAKWTGDGECFCWEVDFDTYKRFDRHWEEEIKYRQEMNVDNGNDKNFRIYDHFTVYPSQLDTDLNIDRNKKYKVTIIVEEVK